MEVILSTDIQTLGKLGEVVKVKDGYARNFLLPRKLAYVATPSNLKRIEQQEKKSRAQNEQAKKDAEVFAAKLSNPMYCHAIEIAEIQFSSAHQEYAGGIRSDLIGCQLWNLFELEEQCLALIVEIIEHKTVGIESTPLVVPGASEHR